MPMTMQRPVTVGVPATARLSEHRAKTIHPVWVRVTHWVNAIAMLVMIGSGWQIYNASPLFRFRVPALDHARRLACRRAAVAFRGDVGAGDKWSRLSHARHCDRPFPPQTVSDPAARICRDTSQRCAASSRMTICRSTTPCRRLLYLGVILARHCRRAVRLVDLEAGAVSGTHGVFGGYDTARYVHFFAMAAIVALPGDPRRRSRCWCRKAFAP